LTIPTLSHLEPLKFDIELFRQFNNYGTMSVRGTNILS